MQTIQRLPHYVNVFFGEGNQRVKSFTVQQGEYNSREVVCSQYSQWGNGRNSLMNLDGITVMVVYDKDNGAPSPEYKAEIVESGKVRFVIPKSVLTTFGDAQLQLRLYGEDCLLMSAIQPFKIKKSIAPSTGADDDDVQPAMLIILQQMEDLLEETSKAEEERRQAEARREERFLEYEKIISNAETASQQVYNANTRFEFPSIGSANVIYKAEKEKKLYQWNETQLIYEALGDEPTVVMDIEIINGGDAYGTN